MMKGSRQWRAVPLLAALCLVWAVPSAYADGSAVEVNYTGSEDEQVVAGSELFAYVDNGLPGDVFAGSMRIANGSSEACEVFVRAQDVIAKGPNDMLERIPFTLEVGGEAVFDGALSDMESVDSIGLGVLEPGSAVSVDCAAVIPSELTSEYADAAVGMNLAVGMHARTEEDSDGNLPVSAGADRGASLVRAGDALVAVPFVLGALASVGTVIWCAWKRRMRMW